MRAISSAMPRAVARASTMLATKRGGGASRGLTTTVPTTARATTTTTTTTMALKRRGVDAFGARAMGSSSSSSSHVTRAVTEAEQSEGILPKREPEDDGEGDEKEFDIFRDSALRYRGYANEVGEAFVAWVPAWGVPATYGVAATYVLMDTVDKGLKRWKKAEGEEDQAKQAATVALDTVTWQMLASVFWPGSFIRVVVATTNWALAKADVSAFDQLAAQGLDVERLLPTLMGLAAIPVIVKPIDHTIDAAADLSFSKALKGEMKEPQEWAVGAGVIGACLALPPILFSVAGAINEASGVVVG